MAKAKKLPSGSWRVQASITIDGRLIRKSFTDPERRKAELAAAQWQATQEESLRIENITLGQAYDRYIASKENILSPYTIEAYKRLRVNTFQDLMGLKIHKINQTLIQISVNELAANHSPKYVRNAHGLLSAVLKMFMPSLSLNTTMPQKRKTEMYIPDDEDIKKLIKSVKGTEMEIPILLAAFGPMRRGEICAITSDDIHENIITVNKALVPGTNEKWSVRQPKTFSSNRDIVYPDFVINRLQGISGKITTLTPSQITKKFPKILEQNGIPHFRFHDLRHYTVSILHAMNVPDKYIMQRGGWNTNYTMHNVYNHTLKKNQDAETKKILKHFEQLDYEQNEPQGK